MAVCSWANSGFFTGLAAATAVTAFGEVAGEDTRKKKKTRATELLGIAGRKASETREVGVGYGSEKWCKSAGLK